MATITLTLPDDLAAAVAELGLLDPPALIQILQTEIHRRALAEICSVSEHLSAAGLAPMTEDEIQAEIDAARADKRAICS
jgi:hypothetical protein